MRVASTATGLALGVGGDLAADSALRADRAALSFEFFAFQKGALRANGAILALAIEVDFEGCAAPGAHAEGEPACPGARLLRSGLTAEDVLEDRELEGMGGLHPLAGGVHDVQQPPDGERERAR